ELRVARLPLRGQRLRLGGQVAGLAHVGLALLLEQAAELVERLGREAAVGVRLPLGASATATSEFLFVGLFPAAGAAFVFTLTAFAGGDLTALTALAAGFAALTALAGLATALAAGFAVLVATVFGFGVAFVTTGGSAFFRVVFDAALAGTLAAASAPPRAFEAGLSRDLLAPARAMTPSRPPAHAPRAAQ